MNVSPRNVEWPFKSTGRNWLFVVTRSKAPESTFVQNIVRLSLIIDLVAEEESLIPRPV